jgi:hypothetical protein
MRKHGFHGHHRHHWIYFLLIIVGGLAVFGFGIMYLWNWLLPPLFHLPVINFWQAVGLLVLSRLLFGGLGRAHAMMHGHGGFDFRQRMMERWAQMSPEDREKFMKQMNRRGGGSRGRGRGCCQHEEDHKHAETEASTPNASHE